MWAYAVCVAPTLHCDYVKGIRRERCGKRVHARCDFPERHISVIVAARIVDYVDVVLMFTRGYGVKILRYAGAQARCVGLEWHGCCIVAAQIRRE